MKRDWKIELSRDEFYRLSPIIFNSQGNYNEGFLVGGAPGYTLFFYGTTEDVKALCDIGNIPFNRFRS